MVVFFAVMTTKRAKKPCRDPLEKAVKLAGGQTQMAAKLSEVMGRRIRQGHVWKWLNDCPQVPAEYVLPIERVVDGAITRHDLRPDIYPIESRV